MRPALSSQGTGMPSLCKVMARVLVDQMRAVDGSRLGGLAGRLDTEKADELDRAVRMMLGVL